jgi:hypothetical protein
MKLDRRQVRLLHPWPWPTRRRVRFVGKDGTVQLLETALVFEGHAQRLGMPVLDLLFRMALSEWTTVTIPYSRILAHRHDRLLVWRALVWVLLLLSGVPVLAGAQHNIQAASLGLLLFTLPALMIFLYCEWKMLAPRTRVLFQRPDGTRVLVIFRILSRKQRQVFEALLQSNCQLAKCQEAPVPASAWQPGEEGKKR